MQNFQIPGIDSEVCSCRHCHWGSIDALLAQEQDMVIVQYEGNWALLQHQRRTDVEKTRSILDQEDALVTCIPYLPIQAST